MLSGVRTFISIAANLPTEAIFPFLQLRSRKSGRDHQIAHAVITSAEEAADQALQPAFPPSSRWRQPRTRG